jgi:sugar O-acyltransferase (sialic acid O-acetyltransferase NeuD family)
MTCRLVVAGNAITAQILHGYLGADPRYEVAALTVDDEFVEKGGVDGIETVPLSKLAGRFRRADCRILMAIGYDNLNRVRESVFTRLKEMGYAIETYVHPDARVHTRKPLGEGCVVLPGAVIEPHAQVGANTMVWSNVTLAHHCSVAEHCWIAAGTVVSGQAKIRRNTFIGVNATVVNDITVEEFNVVGAAALVSKDTKPRTVHLARSAEPFRFPSDEYVKYFKV